MEPLGDVTKNYRTSSIDKAAEKMTQYGQTCIELLKFELLLSSCFQQDVVTELVKV